VLHFRARWTGGESVAVADGGDAVADHVAVGALQIGGVFVTLLIAAEQVREALGDEGQKNAPGAGLQEEHGATEVGGAVVAGGFGEAVEARFLIGDEGHDRVGEDADCDARL